jgi:hypothetical protein
MLRIVATKMVWGLWKIKENQSWMREIHLKLFNIWSWTWKNLYKIEFKCKKRKKVYELNLKFQDFQVAKLQWAKSVVSENMFVTHVQCKIFTKVIGKEKLLTPEFDYFYKHVGTKKILPPCLVFLKVNSIMLRIVNILKMRCFMFPRVGKMCWIGLCKVRHMKAWRKSLNLPLFSTYSKKGKPMLEYESLKGLLHFLQVNFFLQKH